jgi:hypothetical protein
MVWVSFFLSVKPHEHARAVAVIRTAIALQERNDLEFACRRR